MNLRKPNKDTSNSLMRSSAVLGFTTLFSRILGFIRDTLLAQYFGSSAAMDAFLVAFRFPNFLRKIFSEGVMSQVLVPHFSAQKTDRQLTQLFQQLIGLIGGFTLLISILGILFANIWIIIFAPGFYVDPHQFALSQSLLKIMFGYLFFISINALLSSILNYSDRFFLPALMPAVLNIVMLVLILFSHYFTPPIYAVAWGVLIAGCLQTILLVLFISKLNIRLLPIFCRPSAHLKAILKKLLPGIIGASVVQMSLLLDTIFASFLPTGSLSWLYYPDRLNQFALGIFGMAIATAILPKLSNQNINQADFNATVNWGIKMTLLITIPAAYALVVLSFPLISTLFHYGNFNDFDVAQSHLALIAFSLGLPAFVLIRVFISALYAKHSTKLALNVSLYCIAFNLLSNTLLIFLLKNYALGYLALAISTTLTAFLNMMLLAFFLHRHHHLIINKQLSHLTLKTIVASSSMTLLLLYLKKSHLFWLKNDFFVRLTHLGWLIAAGIISYIVIMNVLGVKYKHIKD